MPHSFQTEEKGNSSSYGMDGDATAVSKSKENTRRLSVDIEQDAEPHGPRAHHNPGDPNVVDWEGPDDPENPMNWSTKEKWRNASMLAIMTLITSVVLPLLFLDGG
jgi:hypothetical protein